MSWISVWSVLDVEELTLYMILNSCWNSVLRFTFSFNIFSFWDFFADWKSTWQFPEFTWTWEVFNYLPGRGGLTKFLNCQNSSCSLWCFFLGLIFVLSYKVDMAALRHMSDGDLKALGIPMVSTLHWSLLSEYEFACFTVELLAPRS